MLINSTFNILSALLDIILFIPSLLAYFPASFTYCRFLKKHEEKEINALFLPSSGNIEAVIDKFGGLETLNEHNPQGFFSRIIICFFPANRFFYQQYSDSIEIYDFKYLRRFKCLSSLVYLASLVYICRKKKISMVRSLSPYAVGFIGRVVSWIINVPFCVSLHEDDDRRYLLLGKGGERIIFGSRRFALAIRWCVYKAADMILPIRESLKEKVIHAGGDKNKIFVIPHGVDVKLFDIFPSQITELRKKIMTLGPGKKIILSICRHSMDNYIFDMIESVKRLADRRNDFIWFLVGDGPIHSEVRRLIGLYGLNSVLIAPGYLPRQEAIKHWLLSDIGVCLMGGYSLIEAALAAKPIITYDVEWHHELVINGKTGFLIKENDVPGVTDAIEALLGDEKLRINYGVAIRQLAIKQHSLKCADDVKISCYKKLLKIGT